MQLGPTLARVPSAVVELRCELYSASDYPIEVFVQPDRANSRGALAQAVSDIGLPPLNDMLQTTPRRRFDHHVYVVVHHHLAFKPLAIPIMVAKCRSYQAALSRAELRLIFTHTPGDEVGRTFHPDMRQISSIKTKWAFLHRHRAGETPAATSEFLHPSWLLRQFN
jgi:hypothetical protein